LLGVTEKTLEERHLDICFFKRKTVFFQKETELQTANDESISISIAVLL
jgi:hypothetical protein